MAIGKTITHFPTPQARTLGIAAVDQGRFISLYAIGLIPHRKPESRIPNPKLHIRAQEKNSKLQISKAKVKTVRRFLLKKIPISSIPRKFSRPIHHVTLFPVPKKKTSSREQKFTLSTPYQVLRNHGFSFNSNENPIHETR